MDYSITVGRKKDYFMARRQKNKSHSFGKTFIMVFLIMIIIFTGVIFAIDKFGLGIPNPIAGGDGPLSDLYRDSERVNVLLLGDTMQGLTDTIMLGSYDMKNQHVDVISIPRDTYYPRDDYPGAALSKINSVYKTEGIDGIIDAVSNVTAGIPIHAYAVIDENAIEKIVDSMGGVPMNVPFDMKYTDKNTDLHIDLKKGQQTLNGDQAVQFIRYRSGYAQGDIGRVDAQQKFMSNAFKQALGWHLPKVAVTVVKNVDTDLSVGTAARVAVKGIFLNSKDMETRTLPGKSGYENNASYWIVNEDKTENMVRKIYSYEKSE